MHTTYLRCCWEAFRLPDRCRRLTRILLMASRFLTQETSASGLHEVLQRQGIDAPMNFTCQVSAHPTSCAASWLMGHASHGRQLEQSYMCMSRREQVVPPLCMPRWNLSQIRQEPHLLVRAVRRGFEIRPHRQSCLPRQGDPCCCGCGCRPVAGFTQVGPWPDPQDRCPEAGASFYDTHKQKRQRRSSQGCWTA